MPVAIAVLLGVMMIAVVAAAVVPLAHAIATDEGNLSSPSRDRARRAPAQQRPVREPQRAHGLTAARPMA